MATLKSVFDKHFGHLVFDKKLAKKIYNFQIEYLNSDKEYLDFYSSNLLGVHRVRFKPSDFNKFMFGILEVDTEVLNKDLDHVPSVMKINSVTSDMLNLSCVYLIHMFMHSNHLNEKDRHRVCYDIASIFFMRSFAALISYNFPYPSEERIVKIAYSNLSGNSLIKKLGNWFKVLDYRCNALLDKNGIHSKTLKFFLEDKVAYVISDSKDRIKDIIKNYYSEIVKVRDSGDILTSMHSLAMNPEGEISLVDKIDNTANTILNIKTLITNNNIIKEDLVYLIWSIGKNTTTKSIKDVLNWLVDNYSSENNKLVNSTIEEIIKYTHFLMKNKIKNIKNKDVSCILIELKNLYLSTRNEDRDLIELREIVDNVIVKSKGKHISKSLALSTRTAVILYISLIALTN